MKKILICCLTIGSLLFLLANQSHGRYFWEKKVQPEFQTHLNDVAHASLSSTRAWVVGDSGTIARTTDSGLNWSYLTSGTTDDLQAVDFVDSNSGWVVGDAGTILGTTDGGSTWASQSSGVSTSLEGVHFFDSSNGWVVGESGEILNSTDGGSAWSSQTSNTLNTLYGVFSRSASLAWAVGASSTIVNTTDGGSNWSSQTSPVSSVDLRDVDFTSDTQGWIVGSEGTILTTADGGSSWTEQTSNTDQYLYSVDFYDSSYGWAAGGQTYDPGILLRTTDGGSTWLSHVPFKQMRGVSFTTLWDGIAVGRYGVVMWSSDGGAGWPQVTRTAADFYGLHSPDNTNAWACGSMGTVAKSTDGGESWTEQTTGAFTDLRAVSFPSTSNGWAVGMGRKPYIQVPTPTPPNTVLHSTDGGSTWAYYNLGADVDENMYDVFMLDTTTGWICGEYGAVYRTTDGSSWSLMNAGDTDSYDENNTFYGIHFVSSTEGWACGAKYSYSPAPTQTPTGPTPTPTATPTITPTGDTPTPTITPTGPTPTPTPTATPTTTPWYYTFGLMYHSTDSGANWSLEWSYTDRVLYDVFMSDATNGLAAGASTIVLSTTDGGTSWDTVFGPSSYTLYGINFNAPQYDVGLSVGSSGVAYRSYDAGLSWEYQGPATSYDVYGIHMISDVSAIASAAWGELLKYTMVSSTPPIGVIRGQGAGQNDLNLYQYWSPLPGDSTYWEAVARNPSPYYYARDLWVIPSGNDIVAAAPVDIDGDGSDEIAVMKNQGGDYNLYIYDKLQYKDTNYWDAAARNPSPIARDLWYIPSGNNTVAMAGVDGDGDGLDEIAVLKNVGGVQKLYYYNCPRRGDMTWAQAFIRNGVSPYAIDEWFVPRYNNIIAIAGADGSGDGNDELVTLENSGGDYNIYVWKAPDQAGYYLDEFYNEFLQLGYATPDSPVGFGNPQALDAWIIPLRNDIVSITGLNADDSAGQYPGNYDALGVMENYSGDRNFYLWRIPTYPEHSYTDARVRQLGFGGVGTPQSRDLWIIPPAPGGGRCPWILGLEY